MGGRYRANCLPGPRGIASVKLILTLAYVFFQNLIQIRSDVIELLVSVLSSIHTFAVMIGTSR